MIEKLKRIDPNASPEVLNVWLKELPDEIHQVSFTIIDLEHAQQNLKDKLEELKAKILIEITEAEDENGKPKYSNQNVREAALTLELATNPEARTIKESLYEMDANIKRWEAHRDYYDKEFRITKDAVFYAFRNKELNDVRDINKQKAKEISRFNPDGVD